MRRLAPAALLLTLAACPTGRLEGGRYACDPKGDRSANSEQCPGFWRCGLEGFCHAFDDVGTAWRCETSAECEKGYQCGVAPSRGFRECHDPAAGVSWPCDSDPDCSASWVCGLTREADAGECHDPAAPSAFACRDDSQCIGGWKCGLERDRSGRECHDPAKPSDWPCETGVDCVGGWKCGLERDRSGRECHDPAMPADWPCDGDSDCVGGWRCSAQGTCADPKLDALLETRSIDAGAAVRLSPLSLSPFDAISVSPFQRGVDGKLRELIVMKRGGALDALLVEPETSTTTRWQTPDPGFVRFISQGTQTVTYNGLDVLPDRRPRVLGAFPDGGYLMLSLELDGGVTPEALDDLLGGSHTAPSARLKHASGGTFESPAAVLTYDSDPGSRYGFVWGSTEFNEFSYDVDDPAFTFTDVPGNRIRDLAELYPSRSWDCVFVTDSRGLWVSQRGPNYGFEPLDSVELPNQACQSGAAPPPMNRLASLGSRWLAVEQLPAGADARLTLLDVAPLTEQNPSGTLHCTSFTGSPCDPADKLPFAVKLGPCVPCPGAQLLEFAVVGDPGNEPELEARCSTGDAGTSSTFIRLAHRNAGQTACERRLVTGGSALFTTPNLTGLAEPVPGAVAWASATGQLWVGPEVRAVTPLVFDRAANGLLRRGAGADDFFAFTENLVGAPLQGLGLTAQLVDGLQAAVRYRSDWALRNGEIVDVSGSLALGDARIVAVPASPMQVPAGPWFAALVRGQQGRFVVTVAGNQLWAADLERYFAGTEAYAVLTPRLSLSNPLQSLALPETAAPGGPWLEGYAVLGSRVQRIVADTALRWHSEDVPLPSTLVPLEVWFDRGRARVGLDDGVVLGLPSRVPLAPKLPQGVVDYETTCGEQLALSTEGLYRLTATAAASVGRWERLPLPAGFGALEGGRVHALGPDVYVFTRTGEVAHVTLGGASCP